MTRTFPSPCSTNFDDEINLFRNTTDHYIAPSPELKYTFSQDQLRKGLDDGRVAAMIHHGDIYAVNGFDIVHSHFVGMPLFLSREIGLKSIAFSSLRSLLNERIANWRLIGGNDLPVTVAVRGDPVFHDAAQLLVNSAGISIPPRASRVGSYRELADFAAQNPGAIVLGLRGPFAHSKHLVEVAIDGLMLANCTRRDYPISGQISLLLRQNDFRSAAIAQQFVEGFLLRAAEDGLQSRAIKALQRFDCALLERAAAQAA